MNDTPKALGIREIMQRLPHRYPFLLVDRILSLEVDQKKIVAIKNVTINEPFFQGHFPGAPVMPGVLIIEAMAQVSGLLLKAHAPSDQLGLFMSIDQAKFRKPVVPGDQLRLEVELKRFGGRIAATSGKAFVGDQLVAEADMMFALASADAL